jgi:hypothetical protein
MFSVLLYSPKILLLKQTESMHESGFPLKLVLPCVCYNVQAICLSDANNIFKINLQAPIVPSDTRPCNIALFLLAGDLKPKGLALSAGCFVSD